MNRKRPRSRFQPTLDSLPLRIAPTIYGAIPTTDADYTTMPAPPPEICPPPSDLLTTSLPNLAC